MTGQPPRSGAAFPESRITSTGQGSQAGRASRSAAGAPHAEVRLPLKHPPLHARLIAIGRGLASVAWWRGVVTLQPAAIVRVSAQSG
jgi:hypothetical protein